MILCVPLSGECRCFGTHYLNAQRCNSLTAALFKSVIECVFPVIFFSWDSFKSALHLKLMVVRCLRWPAGGEVFMDCSTLQPPPLSLLCLSHAAPDERSSCTNFIPLHRGRTYVVESRQTKLSDWIFFVAGLLLSGQGLHAFESLHQSVWMWRFMCEV